MPHSSSSAAIRVGIVHSLSGSLARYETSLKDAALLAIAQINQSGGVLGRQIEPIVVDSQSDPTVFAQQARSLLEAGVTTLFGGYTSASRKAVLSMLAEQNGLLWYPAGYEGLECSANVFYTGGCLNQQIEPAVDWAAQHQGDRLYLLGSEGMFARTAHQVIRAQLRHLGGTVLGETLVAFGRQDFAEAIAHIQQLKPDLIFSTLNGSSNLAFYQQCSEAGITADHIPIVSAGVSGLDLQPVARMAVGHYVCGHYFQRLDTELNHAFVRQFHRHCGLGRRIGESAEAAYAQVYLWKQAVEQAQSWESDRIRNAAVDQTFEAPGGLVRIAANQHVHRYGRIGKILPDGQIEVIWSGERLIQPLPWLGLEETQFAGAEAVIGLLADVSAWMQRERSPAQTPAQPSDLATETVPSASNPSELVTPQATDSPDNDSLFRFLSEFAPMPIVVTRMSDGQVIYANNQLASMFGASLAELTRRQAPDFYDDPVDQLRLMDTLTQQGSLYNYEVRFKTVDGLPFWVTLSAQPLSLNGEQVFLTTLYDITDRRLAEDALKQLGAKYTALVEQLPAIVYIAEFGADGAWHYVSPQIQSLLNFAPADWLDNPSAWYEQLHPDDRARVMQDEAVSRTNGTTFRSEYRMFTRDGRIVWIRDEAALLPQEPGQPLMMQGVLLNVSDRKHAEEVLRQSEEQLRQQTQQLAITLEELQQTQTQLVGDIARREIVEAALQESLQQLESANQEIISLNARLKRENLRMAAELDVTRQIQRMLLPKEHELLQIEDLEIAGFMEPADEVGGDYYDVIARNGKVKIGIGDVSGHGLESGVLMLMVQTAVRTLLTTGETNPYRFLGTLNQAIYDNLQRMNSDKNLTLTLLDYHAGTLSLTGQHEEIIVIRANGDVERIDTIDLGFPIGLEADIAHLIGETQFQVRSGDVIVLYTDGITEAEDMANVQYGLDRLCDVVQSNRQRSAREIQQTVIDDVLQHIGKQRVYDDITLLILKKK
ncbi:MAG TPA: transporter substrate-binding protein [Crinalium sp.]